MQLVLSTFDFPVLVLLILWESPPSNDEEKMNRHKGKMKLDGWL